MKKYFASICLLLGITLLWAGCTKDNSTDFDVNADVQIKSFTVNGVAGLIDNKAGTITVNLPFGSDVTSLKPTIELPSNAHISPGLEATLNFTGIVRYRVTAGNLYRDYDVIAKITPPITSFSISNINGTINHEDKIISLILPDGTDVSNLIPVLKLEPGVQSVPASGVSQNFSGPVTYALTLNGKMAAYTVNVISNSVSEYAFLGMAGSRAAITNPDEKAAADWFFNTYPTADYVSFSSIENGRSLSNYKAIWWHYDSAQDLPQAVLSNAVVTALKDYRSSGGGLLLTTYAARYVEALGVVPAGRGPNNVFGDFNGAGFIETNNNWGISFKTHQDHPIFAGVETYEPGKAWLLQKGTFRQNHTAWWFVNEWGGYGDGAGWRAATGGINLASENWDDALNGRVGIAEWPSSSGAGNVAVICFGAYDWYSEPLNGGSTSNLYITNIRRMTRNAIDYIKKQ